MSISLAVLLWLLSNELMHLVVEVLHFRYRSVLLKQYLIHIRLRVVSVCHIPIIDTLFQYLLLLASLSLLRKIIDVFCFSHHKI